MRLRTICACVALALLLAGCARSANAPESSPDAPARITRGSPARRAVALTFDTGAGDAGRTAQILDVLQRQNVRATFAVTGLWAENNRDLLLAIAAAGHQIINGGYHGTSFSGASTGGPPLSTRDRASELSRTEVTIYHLTQRSTRPYFRPPYGDVDESVLHDAVASGYDRIVTWTFDASGLDMNTLIAVAQPGAIYRMRTTAPDAKALPHIIDALRAQGYALETLEDLLAPG
jgi:peptidoglycan-N-acetylglucosamine deacetylase